MEKTEKVIHFTPCDVARVAVSCIKNSDAKEADVLYCIAKQFGMDYIGWRFGQLESALDSNLFDEIASESDQSFLNDFVDTNRTYKVARPKKWTRVLKPFVTVITMGVGLVLDAFKLWPLMQGIIEFLTDVEFISVKSTSKHDEEQDEDKRVCDCEPTGRGNGWETQGRDELGRFLPR